MLILPAKTKIESVDVGHVTAQWISVGEVDKGSAILYLHGGAAYSIGSADTHSNIAAHMSKVT